jgi:hypothetical protein
MSATQSARDTYYAAAAVGLRALEARDGRGRRFGADADARWSRFKGKLHDGDRLQMLLRDAASPWPHGFSASRVFQLEGVALDEPFGPTWTTPAPSLGRRLLDDTAPPSLDTAAAALGIRREPVPIPPVRAGTRLVVAGGAAILAAARAFQARDDVDWGTQVTVVADSPAHRQLAGLAGVFIGADQPCPVITSADELPPGGTRIASSDAEPACTARVNR